MARLGRNKGRRGPSKRNTYVTKSGQSIKLNRNLLDKWRSKKDELNRAKALRLAGMPKSRIGRFFYRLHPKRLYRYWFSREGLIMALRITGISIITIFVLLISLFAYFRKDLPNLNNISGDNIGGSVKYYDRTGKVLLWDDVNGVKRIPVDDSQISDYMKGATVAVEDKDFFHHGGFDVRGILRAGINDALKRGGTQGGSTITQQLVRLTNNDIGYQQTISRKVKELILAVELERSYSKKEILTGYLNTAPYGGIEYGVEAAARDYFQKSAKDLTLDEAAFLAAMPKAPTYYSPYNKENFDRKALIDRQQYILDLMAQQGMITTQQRDAAKTVNTLKKVKPRPTYYAGIKAPYFVLLAKQELENTYQQKAGRSGWKVTTTLDLKLQKLAEDQVAAGLPVVRAHGGDTAALVAEDVQTGQVVATVGGNDFSNKDFGQNNYAHWRLPPGSSFKPYDYSTLIENSTNFGAGSVLYDQTGSLPGYPCPGISCLHDFDRRSPGPLTLRYAIGGSRNIPAVKAMLIAGVEKTRDTAKAMGLTSGYNCYQPDVADVNAAGASDQAPCGGSSAIGDGAYLYLDEHVNGYATLSRLGNYVPKTYIMNIDDAAGKPIVRWSPPKGTQVIRPDTAYILDDMISDPRPSYFPAFGKPQVYSNRFGTWKFGAKTGTTNDSKDGLMMGISTKYAIGIWVGYHTRRVAMAGPMESMTYPIWKGWMQGAHADLKPENWQKPKDIQTLPAFIVRSHVGYGSQEPSPTLDIFPAWYKPPNTIASGKPQVIDIVSNKLATECTPPLAQKTINSVNANVFSGDIFVNAKVATSAKDDVHLCDDIKPSVSLNASPNGSDYTLTATVVKGTHPLSDSKYHGIVNFSIDGKVIGTKGISNSGNVSIDYTPNFSGQKTVTAQVIDSVLYDSSGTAVITGASSSLSITSPADGSNTGSSVPVSWSGGSGTFTVYYKQSSSGSYITGCTTSSHSCSINLPGPPSTDYDIKVSDGTDEDKVTVTRI